MPDDLEAAVRAFRDAQAGLPSAQASARQLVADARARLDRARAALAQAIVAAAQSGVRQRDLVKLTGYNRESIRRILRNNGVEADE